MKKYVVVGKIQLHIALVGMLLAILALTTVLAAIYYTKTVDHQASILADGKLQTYQDTGCTTILDSNNWGGFNVSAGNDVKTLDVYLKNEGNVAVNVTWVSSDFTSYNSTAIQYETTSWKLYLVDGAETKLRPQNDTTPYKLYMTAGEVAHLKFYLTAISGSSAGDFTFHTSFRSQSD